MGKHNSIASNTSKKYLNILIGGCPCHLAHFAASKIENFWIDLSHWFDKTRNEKGKLTECFKFCGQEYI